MSQFPLDDVNNPQQSGDDSPDQSAPVSNSSTPAAATPTTGPTAPTTQSAASQQPTQPQTAPQPAQPSQQPSASGSAPVSNAPVSNAPAPVHPSVQRASILRQVATALAGGDRYQTSIDPSTGATVRSKIPLSGRDIGMAIAMEAISGSLAGLGQRGPGATGAAATAGFQQVSAQQRQAQQDQEAQAQQDSQNESQALVRRANAFEVNSRTLLNTSQSERAGVESLKDAVSQNSQLLSDYADAGSVMDSHVSQDDLQSGMASGKYHSAQQVAIPDGFTSVNGRFEQTFSVIADPAAKVPLTAAQAKAYADAGVPGFVAFKTGNIPTGVMVPGYMIASANQKMQAISLMKADFTDVSDALAKSNDKGNQELAKAIPSVQSLLSDPNNGPVFQSALGKLQKYVSHSDQHGMDFYESLQQMAAPSKPNPSNPKQFVPNPDANAAQHIAAGFGDGDSQKGWAILKAYSQQIAPEPIKSPEEAVSIATDPTSTPRDVRRAQAFLAASNQQAAAVAGADAKARAAAKPINGAGTGTASGDVQQAADAIASGKGTFEQLTSGMGREAAAFRRSVESDLLRRYPNINIAALKAYSKAADSQGVQSQVTNARSLFGANGQPGSFDNLEDAIRAVPKSSFPVLSKLGQRSAYQLGSPQMATLLAIKTDIASDLAKFNTGGGSHSSDHQVELYREQLNEAQTPEQVDAVLKDIRAISSKRLDGLVGTNPYLANMVQDVNDPVSRKPRGNAGVSVPQSNRPVPPQGATMKVPGSDGKLHWSDGKQDLGVAQ